MDGAAKSVALQDRVCVVLIRARNPNNIGAAARAMHDFGFHQLRVVNDYSVPFDQARSAVDAGAVLAKAQSFNSVAEAVADCTLVVGTTAVGERGLEHSVHPLAEAANLMRAEVAENSNRIALLFGSEKTGLSNEELSHCRWLLTIPMQEYADLRHASMNLGQAVAVCLYELVRGHHESIAPTATGVKSAELEQLTVLLGEVLEESEYTRKHPANCDAASLRRLVQKMGLDAGTAPVWLGVMRQILWKLRGRK